MTINPEESRPKEPNQFTSKVDEMINKAEERMNPQERVKYFGYVHEDLKNKDPLRNSTPQTLNSKNNSERNFSKPNLVQQSLPNPFKPSIPNFGSNDEATNLRNPQNQLSSHQPRLMNDIDNLRNQQPTFHPYPQQNISQNPYQNYQYPPPQFPYQDPTAPPAEDQNVVALKNQLKKLKKKLDNRGRDDFYSSMQEAIGSFQNRLMGGEHGPNNNLLSNADLLPEERALNNVLRQEQGELKILANLPKDSELYKAKMEHYKEMSQIRMRMEAMLQELGMQRMKKNFEMEMELEERKLQNER